MKLCESSRLRQCAARTAVRTSSSGLYTTGASVTSYTRNNAVRPTQMTGGRLNVCAEIASAAGHLSWLMTSGWIIIHRETIHLYWLLTEVKCHINWVSTRDNPRRKHVSISIGSVLPWHVLIIKQLYGKLEALTAHHRGQVSLSVSTLSSDWQLLLFFRMLPLPFREQVAGRNVHFINGCLFSGNC